MLAAGDMSKSSPGSVSHLPELKLLITLLPRMIITGSHLYIWVQRSTVKENFLSPDDMATP